MTKLIILVLTLHCSNSLATKAIHFELRIINNNLYYFEKYRLVQLYL